MISEELYSSTKKILARLGLFEISKVVYQWLYPISRDKLSEDKRLLLKWKTNLKNYKKILFLPDNHKTVLFFIIGDNRNFPIELVVAEAFRQAGYEPIIVNPRSKYVEASWKIVGINRFMSTKEIQTEAR